MIVKFREISFTAQYDMYSTISPYLGDLPDPQQQRGPGPPGLHRHPLLQAHQDPQLWNGERETHNNYAALWGVLKTNDSLYFSA